MNNTIFDDVFRTMIEKMSYLAVPLINEVFHTSYPEDVKITQLRNEHQQKDGHTAHLQQTGPAALWPAEVRQQRQRQANIPQKLGDEHGLHGGPPAAQMQQRRQHLNGGRVIAEL